VRALIVAALMIGCASAHEAPVRRLGPRSDSAPATPRFHLVARGWVEGPATPTRMTLCPIDGAVFICGGQSLPMVRGDSIVVDRAMIRELALDGSWIGAITGSWPAATWLRVDDVQNHHTFYQWSVDRWDRLGVVQASHAALVPRGSGPLLIARHAPGEGRIAFAAPFGGTAPEPFETEFFHVTDDDFALVDDDVFVLERRVFTSRLHRVGAFTTDIPVIDGSQYQLIRRAGRDLVALGARSDTPVIDVLTAGGWSSVDLAGLPGASDYARDSGSEWIATGERLFVRRANSGLTPVALSGIAAERVWITSDGQTWVLGTRDNEAVLLRTSAPSSVATLTFQ